jgi:hypothetical protein
MTIITYIKLESIPVFWRESNKKLQEEETCTCNKILRRVRATFISVEMQ